MQEKEGFLRGFEGGDFSGLFGLGQGASATHRGGAREGRLLAVRRCSGVGGGGAGGRNRGRGWVLLVRHCAVSHGGLGFRVGFLKNRGLKTPLLKKLYLCFPRTGEDLSRTGVSFYTGRGEIYPVRDSSMLKTLFSSSFSVRCLAKTGRF